METSTPLEPADTAPPEKARKRLTKGLFANVALAVAVAFFTVGAVIPFLTGGTVMTVMTGSMAPSFPSGHILVYHPVSADDLRAGDVVAYRPADNSTGGVPITHRVIDVDLEGGHVIVQGDANPAPDLPVEHEQIIGKMTYYLPYAGLFQVLAFHNGFAWLIPLLSGCLLVYGGFLGVSELVARRRAPEPT